VSRFSRLYPTYWTALTLTFTIVSLASLPGRQVGLGDALMNFPMWQFLIGVPDVDPVYWTLSVELSFYTIMLALYKAKLLDRPHAVATAWLLLILLTSVAESRFGVSLPARLKIMLLLEYAHLFIAGMMFYTLLKTPIFPIIQYIVLASCLVVQWVVSTGEATLIVAVFFLIFYLAIRGYLSFLVWRPLVFLGTISYALYLIHQNIGYVLIRALYQQKINPNVSIAAATIVSLSVASAITFFVEKPLLQAIRTMYAKFREVNVAPKLAVP